MTAFIEAPSARGLTVDITSLGSVYPTYIVDGHRVEIWAAGGWHWHDDSIVLSQLKALLRLIAAEVPAGVAGQGRRPTVPESRRSPRHLHNDGGIA